MRLENKVAVITGGASGIGLAAVKRFAIEGAKVAILDYNEQAGQQVAAAYGNEVAFFKADVSNQEEVQQAVKAIAEHFGQIDILINNAGITRDASLLKMSAADFDKVIQINLNGVFYCTQAVVPYMIE